MNKVLVVIDAQEDFTRGVLKNEAAIKALPVIQKSVNYANNHGMPIIYTMDVHGPTKEDYLKTQEASFGVPPHCIVNTPGCLICKEARVDPYAIKCSTVFISKGQFGYPHFNTLDYYLHDADEIWICGFCTDICVMANFQILKALYPEIPIYVIEDGCAGSTPDMHDAAIRVMNSCQAISIWSEILLTEEDKEENRHASNKENNLL